MADEDKPKFEGGWLFTANYPAEPAQLVEDEAIYTEMLDSGRWKTSPADHGIITAPNQEQAQQMIAAGKTPPGMEPMTVEAGPLGDRVAALEAQMRTLHDALATAGRHYDEQQQELSALERRVEALERAAHSDDQPHTRRR